MTLNIDIGDGADALAQNQYIEALDGTYWIDGWDATLGTGDLEVDIAAGEGAINGGDVSTGVVQTVDFSADVDNTEPRKAVISVDDTGTVQKVIGETAPAAPSGEVRFRTFDPSPPANSPGVVVAEVWLDAGATGLVSDDVRDRRVANQAAVSTGTPSGVITIWSGAESEIPDGWTLCDGSNGTPDLCDRFVVGAGGQYYDGETGGEDYVQLTEGEMPSHTHGGTVNVGATGAGSESGIDAESYSGRGTIGTASLDIGQSGQGYSHENRPPFYALAYIMKI